MSKSKRRKARSRSQVHWLRCHLKGFYYLSMNAKYKALISRMLWPRLKEFFILFFFFLQRSQKTDRQKGGKDGRMETYSPPDFNCTGQITNSSVSGHCPPPISRLWFYPNYSQSATKMCKTGQSFIILCSIMSPNERLLHINLQVSAR